MELHVQIDERQLRAAVDGQVGAKLAQMAENEILKTVDGVLAKKLDSMDLEELATKVVQERLIQHVDAVLAKHVVDIMGAREVERRGWIERRLCSLFTRIVKEALK